MACKTTTEQGFCRGRLESEEKTPKGYAGWRWLQCTDIQDEYRVLIPPSVAQCYAQLQKTEESELHTQHRPVDWKQVAALRHVKDRLIRRCYQLGTFRPGYEPFVKRSIFAPPDFTLRQLERWARDQNVLGFARPSKHRSSSSKSQTPPSSINTPSSRTTATNTRSSSTPLRPASSRHTSSAIMPTQSASAPLRPANGLITPTQSPSTSLRPATVSTTTPTPPTHHVSPATSSSGCVYVVFRCPRHCPVEGCETETQFFAQPNPSHPVTDVLPPRVVPMQSQQKNGCQCYSPYEAQQGPLQPIVNTPTNIREESIESRIVNEGHHDDREPALNSSPPAPIALQLPTPETSTSMIQKPLPRTPPQGDNLNFRQEKREVFATEETQTPTPTPVDEEPQQRHHRPPAPSTFKTLRKQPSAADREFQKQNASLFSLPNEQPPVTNGRQQPNRRPRSTSSTSIQQPPATVLVVTNRSPQDQFSPPPIAALNRKEKVRANAVIPETQNATNPPPTNRIRVDGEDFLLVTQTPSKKPIVKKHATRPEIVQKKKSVRFFSQTPNPIQQLPSRVIQPARESRPLVPQIMITLPSPSNSSEESEDEMYNEQLLVPLAA